MSTEISSTSHHPPQLVIQFCSCLGIFLAPLARQHQELPKASPGVGAEPGSPRLSGGTELWLGHLPQLEEHQQGIFFFFLKDQHPKTAEPSLETLRSSRKTEEGHWARQLPWQSHTAWKGNEELRMLHTATTYDCMKPSCSQDLGNGEERPSPSSTHLDCVCIIPSSASPDGQTPETGSGVVFWHKCRSQLTAKNEPESCKRHILP